MSFRPSVPCRTVAGTANAPPAIAPVFGSYVTLSILPPGAVALEIHTGWPPTLSGRLRTNPNGSGDGAKTSSPLKGKPLRATMTVSIDQFRVRTANGPD